MLKQNGRYEHNGTEYLKGAEHAGLTCWIMQKTVEMRETNGRHNIGDWCMDELIRYLADPDTWHVHVNVLITDEKMRLWPLRNTHKRVVAQPCTTKPVAAQKPAQPSDKGAEWPKWPKWPKWRKGESYLRRYDSEKTEMVFQSNGTKAPPVVQNDYSDWDTFGSVCCPAITPTEAAKWLRENGHEAEAARIQPDTAAVHPALAGARCWRGARGTIGVTTTAGDFFYRYISAPEQQWFVVDRCSETFLWGYDGGNVIEITGPATERILADFAASAAFAEWLGGAK